MRDSPSEGEIRRFSPSEGEKSTSGGSEPVLSPKRASLRVAAPQALWEVIFALLLGETGLLSPGDPFSPVWGEKSPWAVQIEVWTVCIQWEPLDHLLDGSVSRQNPV